MKEKEENIWRSKTFFCGGEKNGKEKGGEFFLRRRRKREKEKIWRRKIFAEGKYLKKENIWRRKIFFTEETLNGEGKGGKCLEKEKFFTPTR